MATTRSAAPPQSTALTAKEKQEKLSIAKKNIYSVLTHEKTKAAVRDALPDMGVTPERVATIAFSVIAGKQTLLECDARSLLKVIIEGSLLGLSFDPHLKQAHIVPFAKQASLIVGYMGLVKLARNGGALKDIDAHLVHEKDEFDYAEGANPTLYHKPPKLGTDRGHAIGVYAIATLPDGSKKFRVLSAADVEFYREKSKAKDASDSPWNTDPASMWRKTAIRRLMAYMPLDEKTQRAAAIDELAETGNDQMLAAGVFTDDDEIIDLTPTQPEKSKTETRKEELRQTRGKVQQAQPAAAETHDGPEEEYDKLWQQVSSTLDIMFARKVEADLAISEATNGKYQSRESLLDAEISVLQQVKDHLTQLSAQDDK